MDIILQQYRSRIGRFLQRHRIDMNSKAKTKKSFRNLPHLNYRIFLLLALVIFVTTLAGTAFISINCTAQSYTPYSSSFSNLEQAKNLAIFFPLLKSGTNTDKPFSYHSFQSGATSDIHYNTNLHYSFPPSRS